MQKWQHTLQMAAYKMMKGLKSQIGLTLFIAACVISPGLMQLVIAYTPSFSKGTFSLFEAIGSGRFYSVENRRMYQLAYEDEIMVSGRILPRQLAERVSLEINGERYLGSLKLDGWGGFRARVPLKDYENTIVAHGPWGSHAAVYVFYLPKRDPALNPPPVPRTVSLTLSPKQASVTYTATYSERNGDMQDFIDLQSEALGGDLFVKRVFYPNNDDFTGWEFSVLSTSFARDKDARVVTASGTLSGRKYIPENVSRILGVTPQPDDVPDAQTTIILNLDHISLISPPRPWPNTWQGNTLQWNDPSEPITIKYGREAVTEFGPASVERLAAGIQRAIAQINDKLNRLLLPIIPIIPFVWILLSAKLGPSTGVSDWAKRRPLFVLALLMWLVPGVALVVPFAEIIHHKIFKVYLPALGFSVPPLPKYPPELPLWASSLTYCILLFFACRLSVQQGTTGRAGWAKWLALILAAFFLSACFVFFEGYIPILLFPMAILVLGIWIWLICELYSPGQSQFRKTFGSWPARIGLAVVLMLLACPISATMSTFSPAEGWQPQHWAQFYFILGPFLLPYTIFAGLAPILRARRSDQVPPDRARACRLLGRLIFAAYVIGFLGGGLGGLQFTFIPFLVAVLWIYPYLVERTKGWDFLRPADAKEELDKRPAQIADLRRKQWKAKEEAKRKAKEEEKGMHGGLPKEYDARRAIFAFGPTKRPWENAKLSCLYGLILSTMLFLAYSPLIFERAVRVLNTPFPVLQILGVFVLPFFAKWLLAAFLLGYFFPYIRGFNGLQKGLVLAIGILVCTLPINALLLHGMMGDPLALLWDAGQTILFLTILGFWAFDLNTVRRYGLGWADLLREHGLSFVVPYLSTIAAAIGGAAISVITGRAETIVKSVLELVLRGAPPSLGGG